MVDAIVRDDPALDLAAVNPPGSATTDRVRGRAHIGPARAASAMVGVGIAAILCAYFLTGSVRINAGTRSGLRYRIDTIWSDFTGFLVRQGASAELVIVVSSLAVLSVLGSCLLIGLAFAIRDEDSHAK